MAQPSPWSQGAKAAAVVSQMAISTVVAGLIGRQADLWLETSGPWLAITGFVLGFTLGMITLLRSLTPPPSHDDDDHPPPTA